MVLWIGGSDIDHLEIVIEKWRILAVANEGAMRRILRSGWSGPGALAWVEHARGGTEGNPDVFVPLGKGHGYLPLELKWWRIGSAGEVGAGMIEFKARPAQIRFHRLAYEAGQRTAFLVLLSSGDIVLMPGSVIPKRAELKWISPTMFRFLQGVDGLRSALTDEKFWRGKVR